MSPEIDPAPLYAQVAAALASDIAAGALGPGAQIPPEGLDFERVLAETEKRYLQVALEKSGGVRTQAAEILKISYRSFRHYAKKHNL